MDKVSSYSGYFECQIKIFSSEEAAQVVAEAKLLDPTCLGSNPT